MEDILAEVKYGFPSWDPRDERFEPQRYWRGPVWAIVNYMIAEGMKDCGYGDLSHRIMSDTRRLIDQSGFYEYFNPLSGEGCGGQNFTWTAAIRLVWADGDCESQAA